MSQLFFITSGVTKSLGQTGTRGLNCTVFPYTYSVTAFQTHSFFLHSTGFTFTCTIGAQWRETPGINWFMPPDCAGNMGYCFTFSTKKIFFYKKKKKAFPFQSSLKFSCDSSLRLLLLFFKLVTAFSSCIQTFLRRQVLHIDKMMWLTVCKKYHTIPYLFI